jgi:pimeloyl-ACP methyl ester carboxylesterase
MAVARGVAEVNGARLAYECSGEGPAVAFIHGFTLDRRMWDDQAEPFSKRFRVIRHDLRGFGASSTPTRGGSYTHVGDLAELLDQLEVERVALVALSMGGWVAIEFAQTFPERVSALVLVDSTIRGFDYGPVQGETIERLYRLGREGRLAEAKTDWLNAPLFAHSRTMPAVQARLAEMVADYSAWHLQNDDPHPALEPPSIPRLGEIAAPTLVIVGEHDVEDFQTIADLLAARIPNARKLTLSDAGHMANMDAPAAFNQAVLAFLTEVPPPT